MAEEIQAVFENGVFRPLEPVDLPEHQKVTLRMPEADRRSERESADMEAGTDEEMEMDEVAYEPLPLRNRKTMKVTLRPNQESGTGNLCRPRRLDRCHTKL